MKKTLVKGARYLVSSTPFGILENASMVIEDDRIAAVGPAADLDALGPFDEIVDAAGKIVMPGLVDAHNHVGEAHMFVGFGFLQEPLRGIADALEKVVWPAFVWMDEEKTYDMEMFGLLNLLKSGTTTVSDAFMFPDASARAAIDSGLRVEVSPTLITSLELPDQLDPETTLRNTEEAIRKWHGAADGRITYRVHASATYNCHEWFLRECMALAKKYDVGFCTHVAESVDEKEKANARWPQGEIRRLYDMGLMGPKSLFFHCCVLDEEEIALFAKTDTKVAHNPLTNCMLGNCAWVPKLLMEGVTVGLGTDMPIATMFNVMRCVSQIHSVMPRDPRGLMPWTPLELATAGSARALNMEDSIGTLEPGKKADWISLDLRGNTRLFPLTPAVLTTIVTAGASGCDLCDVMVDGKMLMQERTVLGLDQAAIIEKAARITEEYVADFAGKAESTRIRTLHEEFMD